MNAKIVFGVFLVLLVVLASGCIQPTDEAVLDLSRIIFPEQPPVEEPEQPEVPETPTVIPEVIPEEEVVEVDWNKVVEDGNISLYCSGTLNGAVTEAWILNGSTRIESSEITNGDLSNYINIIIETDSMIEFYSYFEDYDKWLKLEFSLGEAEEEEALDTSNLETLDCKDQNISESIFELPENAEVVTDFSELLDFEGFNFE